MPLYFFITLSSFYFSFLIHWQTTLIQGGIVFLFILIIFRKNLTIKHLKGIPKYIWVLTFLFLAFTSYMFRIWTPFSFYFEYIPNWKYSWWQFGNGGLELQISKIFIFRLWSVFEYSIFPFLTLLLLILFLSIQLKMKRVVLIQIFLLLSLTCVWILEPINDRYTLKIVFGYLGLVLYLVSRIPKSKEHYLYLFCLLVSLGVPLQHFSDTLLRTIIDPIRNVSLSQADQNYLPRSISDAWNLMDIFESSHFTRTSSPFLPYFQTVSKRSSNNSTISVIDPNNETGWGGYKSGTFALWSERVSSREANLLYEQNTLVTGSWPGEMRIRRVADEVNIDNFSGLMNADYLVLPLGFSKQYLNFEKYDDPNPIYLDVESNILKAALDFSSKILLKTQSDANYSSGLYEITNTKSWQSIVRRVYCGAGLNQIGAAAYLEMCESNTIKKQQVSLDLIPDPDKRMNVASVTLVHVQGQKILKIQPFDFPKSQILHLHFLPIEKRGFLNSCVFLHADRNLYQSTDRNIYQPIESLGIKKGCKYYVRIINNDKVR
jgi:hypothetical protein